MKQSTPEQYEQLYAQILDDEGDVVSSCIRSTAAEINKWLIAHGHTLADGTWEQNWFTVRYAELAEHFQ